MLQTTRTRLVAPGLDSLVFRPWNELQAEMERLAAARRPDADEPVSAWVPAVDVEEGEDGIRLAFEVPASRPKRSTSRSTAVC
jgi:HSP20 family molecular chaperone IbpA